MNGVALSIVLGQLGALFGFGIEAGGICRGSSSSCSGCPDARADAGDWPDQPRAAARLAARLVARSGGARALLVAAVRCTGSGWSRPACARSATSLPACRPQWPTVPAELLPTLLAEAAAWAGQLLDDDARARSFADRNRYEVDADRELAALERRISLRHCRRLCRHRHEFSHRGRRGGRRPHAGDRPGLRRGTDVAAALLHGRFVSCPRRRSRGAGRAGLKLIDVRELKAILRIEPQEFWLSIIATVGVVVFGPINAIVLVIALSLLRFVR